ncbi:Retinal guanylyl cyclase 2 [Bagarius yarrelli]|uniref:Guanylate cyclase n=1 Tax=Bagarius yarrelli TaxID=175774 RepID=A0A556VUB3_BAGYA|nr:Retinal guanylyl cyclase 2 [Bagarius yarrelli]
MYSKALPDLAARLAMARINKDPYLSKGYWYDYTLINEDCQTSRALARFIELEGYGSVFLGPANPGYCTSAALLVKNWNAGILSWACLSANMDDGTYPTFLRPLPLSSRVLFSVLRFFHWAHVAVVSEENNIWEATGQELAASLRTLGLPISTVITMKMDENGPRKALEKIREADRVRVIIMCMHSVLMGGGAQYKLLTTAMHMRMIDRGYVFIPYDTLLYSLPYKNVTYSVLANDTQLRRAYDGVLTITVDQGEQNFYEAFKEAQDRYEIHSSAEPEQVSPFFGTIYNMLYYTAMATEKTGSDGEGMQVRYVVLDTDGAGDTFQQTHVLEAPHTYGKFGALKYMGKSIHFAGASPSTDPNCWFSSYMACSGGMDGVTFFFLCLLFCALISASVFLYHMKMTGQLGMLGGGNSSPNKIVLTLDDLVFINTQLSRRKLNEDSMFKSQLDEKTPQRSIAGRSYFTSTPEISSVAVFEGDWVWLKKCQSRETVTDISEGTQAIFITLRDMRQENLNLYLGLFLDSGIFGIGMKHLHNRGIIHGRLKSRNCVVDGRFVLKVTDYGLNEIISSLNISQDSRPEDQLWTAPELLRNMQLMKSGTYMGDVYSFAIIMQEVISRSAPFCMLDLPAKEIIEKVCNPPPLCRPCVSMDEAPLEVIQIMKQAWSENPELRPSFEEIFKQFKTFSKGRKTNIIDSMLRMLEQYSSNLEDLIRERTEELEVERQKTDALVAQMLPKSVALALKKGKPVKPEHFAEATLYFSDIVGFTTISALSEPIEVVETIGDAYMVASGVPTRNGNRHAAEMANMSLDILSCIGTFKMRHMPSVKVKIRIGLHSGPVVAGVVGLTMPRYCLFGDTVNTASRMESTGLPYRIHVNQSTVDILQELKLGYQMNSRGKTELKGKGVEETFWLVGREGFTKPLPIPPDLTPGASNHGISLEEIPSDRRQRFLDRQQRMG